MTSQINEMSKMAVKAVGGRYKCNVLGNEMVMTNVGGGTIICYGQDMENIG